jgi:hypothetical protein
MSNSYYIVRKRQLMKDFDRAAASVKHILISHYEPVLADSISEQTRQVYEGLIYHLPYVGGDANPLTRNLIGAAWFLALYRVLKSYGKSVHEVGQICYEATEQALHTSPNVLRHLLGRLRLSGVAMGRLRRQAEASQLRSHPDDWVFTVIKGDGKTFDFGVDYTECGIVKFYREQGTEEFTPYLCLLDYPMSQALGTGMARTMTLAEGCEKCDFRFKLNREVPRAWPPKFASRG